MGIDSKRDEIEKGIKSKNICEEKKEISCSLNKRLKVNKIGINYSRSRNKIVRKKHANEENFSWTMKIMIITKIIMKKKCWK